MSVLRFLIETDPVGLGLVVTAFALSTGACFLELWSFVEALRSASKKGEKP